MFERRVQGGQIINTCLLGASYAWQIWQFDMIILISFLFFICDFPLLSFFFMSPLSLSSPLIIV